MEFSGVENGQRVLLDGVMHALRTDETAGP